MRRGLILLLLLFGMQLIQPLARATPSSAGLLTFGFLILAAYTVGEIGLHARLPKLVGYLIAGIVFGPSVLGVVSQEAILRLRAVSDLAIALIAFMAGAELEWHVLKQHGGKYLRILSAEMALTFAVLFATVMLLRASVPAIAQRETAAAVVFALLMAAVLVAHSPAATMGLLSETKARGPLARTSLGVVLVSDVVLIVLFTLVAALSRAILPPAGEAHMPSLPVVTWEIGGAFIVGAAIGGAVAVYLRFASRELLLFGMIVALFGAEIARLTHVELLLTLLAAGFVMENLSRAGRGQQLRDAVERAAAPLFVVFFALAGASIAVAQVFTLIELVLPLVLVRMLALWLGSALGTRWAEVQPVERKYVWTSLVAQAGVAIGLATIVADVYPGLGTAVRTIALAVIAVNQLLGPVLFRRALAAADEIAAG